MDDRLRAAESIVFDVGNVLLRFDPKAVCSLLPQKLREPFYHSLFVLKNWAPVDSGLIPQKQVAQHAADEAGMPEEAHWVLYLFEHFHEVMTPMPLYRMIPELRQCGKRLFALTNYPQPSFSYALQAFPLLQTLDGILVSSEEKLVKPDLRIFRLAEQRFSLDPAKTLFIDDTLINVQGALAAGWNGWHYTPEG